MQRYFFLTNFPAGSNGEPARMLKCKKVEKLFPLDQMVVKRLCNNVAENLKKFSRRDKCCPRDYAIIGKKKSFPAVTDGVTATMLK